MYKRLLFVNGLPDATSFVFGPRQTGKTTLLRDLDSSLTYDLLTNSEFLRLNKDPDLLYKECSKLERDKKQLVWIDEVQKIPSILDVVHKTIEQYKNINFILSGSSARKLKRYGVNLLGGRALDYKFHPMTAVELESEFDLEQALHFGTLPRIYQIVKEQKVDLAIELLSSYVSTYLEEEIKKEALVRELAPFQRFLEVAAQAVGSLINFSKISDDSQVQYSAVANYFSILEDTLLGFFLPPYHLSVRKQLRKQPKFYFFDNGVNRAILNTLRASQVGLEKGTMFEQFVIQEVRRLNDYYRKNFKLYFWRTEAGAEIDLLICSGTRILLAIECKATRQVSKRDLSGLRAFNKDYPSVPCYICAPIERDIEVDRGFDAITLESLVKKLEQL
jgi:predicted AAA+ superfamily ATPase